MSRRIGVSLTIQKIRYHKTYCFSVHRFCYRDALLLLHTSHCPKACKASGPCAHTIKTVCGGVRLCCARGRSDAVRNRASSSLSRDCRGGVVAAVQSRVQSQQFDHAAVLACVACGKQCCHSEFVTLTQTQFGIGGIPISITRLHQSHVNHEVHIRPHPRHSCFPTHACVSES